ncbi:CheR family methyltransferase [Sinorhizobium fredii]|nr:Chemotaxis protein methyltransferase [Sinorhizobium fredii NGR234]
MSGAMLLQAGALAGRIADRIGLSIAASRKEAAVSAIGRVMARRGLNHVSDLLGQIDADEDLKEEFIDELTVGETHFFRGAAQFDLIRDTILPERCRSRLIGSPLRIWSLGCASGEEPYSLAILCEADNLSSRVEITASDISRKALSDAAEAEYGEWSLRNTGECWRQRYFLRSGSRYRVRPDLARRVTLTKVALGADVLPAPQIGLADFDLILCRNVLVYLDAAAVHRIARQLFTCLVKGGWLMTAPTDPPLWKYAPFETSITSAGAVYRRAVSGRERPADDRP